MDNNNEATAKAITKTIPELLSGISESLDEKQTFGYDSALKIAKNGDWIARKGWNGKALAVTMVKGATIQHGPHTLTTEPFFIINNTYDGKVNTWVPSVSDLLAEDWFRVN